MTHLNGSQHWFSRNSARVISHLENPATVEGISWGDLWCEWKRGHTGGAGAPWLQQPSILPQLSPPEHHNLINVPHKVLNGVFWFQKISNKKMYSLQRISHRSWLTILQSRHQCPTCYFWVTFQVSSSAFIFLDHQNGNDESCKQLWRSPHLPPFSSSHVPVPLWAVTPRSPEQLWPCEHPSPSASVIRRKHTFIRTRLSEKMQPCLPATTCWTTKWPTWPCCLWHVLWMAKDSQDRHRERI